MFSPEKLVELAREKARWEEDTLKKNLAKMPERKEAFFTSSGLETQRLYTPLDLQDFDYQRDLGFPGEYPFTRGIQPTMYRGRVWSMRQYAGFGTPEESNRRFRYLLEQGQTGLSIAFDLPTQIGYDSDHPLARGEVGKVGVSIDSLQDMEIMLENIPLDKVSTSMTINAPTAVILAMYLCVAKKQGVPFTKLDGTTQNDILKEYLARGTYIFPPQPSVRLFADTVEFCVREMPRWNYVSIGGYHIREAGANAVQEVGFAFANALTYVRAVLERGLKVDDFAPRISWIFNTQNNFFEEVAKYRAARRLWARIMRERFGAQDPRSWMFRTHVQDGGSTLTAQQPLNNLVRSTVHALATVLGGVQSMAICSFDEALSIPTEQSAMLSLRIQQIIAHETGVTDTVDPLGGSYYVEALTDQLEKEITACIDEIEALGGAVAAIEKGYLQRKIQESAYRAQREIEKKERIIVGLNAYETEEKVPIEIQRVDREVEKRQIEKLNKLRKERNQVEVRETLRRVREAAEGGENLMPAILEAAAAYATLGEICGVLREVFGEYKAYEEIA